MSPVLVRAIGLLTLCFGLAGLDGTEARAQEALVFGVRADAPPFSYHLNPPHGLARAARPGTPGDHGFGGFVVDLCNAVLDELAASGRLGEFAVQTRIVNAGNRFELLREGAVHILCDPATIMPERLRPPSKTASEAPQRLNVSVPVYMSAVTFAQPRDLPGGEAPCRILVGAVGETTSVPRGIGRILEAGSFGRWTPQIEEAIRLLGKGEPAQVIAGRTGDETCPGSPAIRAFATHDDIAQAFCNDEVLYYVGDIEIIRSMISARGCLRRSVIAPATFTDERYGIFTALPDSARGAVATAILDFLAELSFQIYEKRAAQDGTEQTLLDRTYRDTFPDFQPSQKLRAFFWSVTGSMPHRP